MPCGGVYFEYAQNKRRGLAFAQRVRKLAVLEHREHAVKMPCNSTLFCFLIIPL